MLDHKHVEGEEKAEVVAGAEHDGAGAPIVDPLALRAEVLFAFAASAWGLYFLEYAAFGRVRAALNDLAMVAVLWAVRAWVRGKPAERLTLGVHVGAAASTIGLLITAMLSGQSESTALWFLGAIPLFVSYALGPTQAAPWAVVVAAVLGAVYASEQFVVLEPEFLSGGIETVASQVILVAILLMFSVVSRRLSERHVAALVAINDTSLALAEEVACARDDALAAARAKGEFVATMTHELRTPMNAVLGSAALLEGTPLNQEQQEHVRVLRAGGEQLLELINNVLDFSKIEAGKLTISEGPFDVRECVQKALDLVASRASEKGLALRYEPDETVPPLLVADVGRIRQILVNLVGNAVKFTDAGEVVVTASVAPAPDGLDACDLSFRVRDTGPGVPAARANHLFDPFTQLDASRTRRYGGTGLGLAISKRLAIALGGRIWYEDAPGGGAVFCVTVRVRKAENQASIAPPAARRSVFDLALAPGKDAEHHALRILIAEDNPVNQKVIVRLLERMGYAGDTVSNGREAVDAVARDHYDLVFLDVQMPEMDGLTAARTIVSAANSGPRPWLVALTANVSTQDRDACFAAGMDDFLSKPVMPPSLRAAIERCARAGQQVVTSS